VLKQKDVLVELRQLNADDPMGHAWLKQVACPFTQNRLEFHFSTRSVLMYLFSHVFRSQFRYYFDPAAVTCSVRYLATKMDYGFEYTGLPPTYIAERNTDAVTCALLVS